MKHIPRIYTAHQLKQGLNFSLSEDHINHLFRVLRMKEGEQLFAFNNIDGEWACEIINAKKGLVQCIKQVQKINTNEFGPTVACAIINMNAMSWMLEKVTELGVYEIIPIITKYTTHHKNFKENKAKKIIIQACEQCRRLHIPKFQPPITLVQFLQNYDRPQTILFGDERLPKESFYDHLEKNSVFLIGPEGGFSNEEYDLLDRYDFVKKVKISKNILRSETAAVAFVAGWNCKFI